MYVERFHVAVDECVVVGPLGLVCEEPQGRQKDTCAKHE